MFHGFCSVDFGEVGRGEDTHNFHQKNIHLTQENLRNSLPTFTRKTSCLIGLMNVFRCFFKAFLSLWISVRKCFMTFRSAGVAVI